MVEEACYTAIYKGVLDVRGQSYIGQRVNLYWFAPRPILVRVATYIGSLADLYRLLLPPREVGV